MLKPVGKHSPHGEPHLITRIWWPEGLTLPLGLEQLETFVGKLPHPGYHTQTRKLNVLEENIGVNLLDIDLGDIF